MCTSPSARQHPRRRPALRATSAGSIDASGWPSALCRRQVIQPLTKAANAEKVGHTFRAGGGSSCWNLTSVCRQAADSVRRTRMASTTDSMATSVLPSLPFMTQALLKVG
jgi:hypothetical protein